MDNLLDLTSRVEGTHFWFRGFRRFVAPALVEVAGSRRDLHLLDCGCGTGYNLATLLRPYGRALGFDVTPGGLLRARARALPVARASMSAIPFQSSRFDVVTSFDVMQYVKDDYAAMKEMARVLKPGGGLVVTAAALNILRGGHAGTWPEVRRYTARRMRSIVEGAGMKVQRLTYLFATLLPAMLAVRALNRSTPPSDWEMRVPAAPINTALTWVLTVESAISRRIPMPAGSSVLVVARKI